MFMEDEIVNIVQRAEKLRHEKNFIKFAENPNPKMQRLLEGYNQLKGSAAGVDYNIVWFCSTLLFMISSNPCYSIFRQAPGNLNKLLKCKTPQEAISMINHCWVDNHKEWAKMNFGNSSRSSISNRTKPGNRNNGNGNSTCTNCKKKGHTVQDCMNKGGGRETKCYNCNNFGHIARDCRKLKTGGGSTSKPPCTYRNCRGRRETHSTANCFSKQNDERDNKRARASEKKLKSRKSRKIVIEDSSDDDDADDAGDVAPPRSRASGARPAGVLLPPSNARVVTEED